MQLIAYREYDLCGDEFLREDDECLIALTLDGCGTINLTYHPGLPDEEMLGMPQIEQGTTKVFLTVRRDCDTECYHITMLEFAVFAQIVYRR